MVEENSYGIVPLCKYGEVWHVLLIQHFAGHWGFPKGHAENDENSYQAASRELFEETGLTVVRFLSDIPLKEKYKFFFRGKHIEKEVTYFLAETAGKLVIQKDEIKAAKWVPLTEAEKFVTFPAAKSICKKVQELVA